MGSYREEATVALGADVGTIERNLGIGKSYFDRWGKQLKTDQEKYTEWWAQELKKREEMEVAASVRAAQRSNQARKLWRQRASDRADKIADEIGQGSIPDSLKGFSKNVQQAAKEGEEAMSHWGGHARHEIHGAAEIIRTEFGGKVGEIANILKGFAFGYVTVIAYAAIEGWKQFTEWLANQTYGVGTGTSNLVDRVIENKQKMFRQAREDRDKQKEEDVKEEERLRKEAQERMNLDEQLGEVLAKKHEAEAGGTETEKGRESHGAFLANQVTLRQLDFDRTSMAKDRAQYLKAEIELEKAKTELITFQKEEETRKAQIKKQQADFDRQRQEIMQGEINKFLPTLRELSQHGAFTGPARQALRLERQIKRDFLAGNVGQAKKDLAERDKIYDQIAGKGVLSEREEKRQLDNLARKQAEDIANIANGKAPLTVNATIVN